MVGASKLEEEFAPLIDNDCDQRRVCAEMGSGGFKGNIQDSKDGQPDGVGVETVIGIQDVDHNPK